MQSINRIKNDKKKQKKRIYAQLPVCIGMTEKDRIRDRRQAKDVLRESKKRFHLAFKDAAHGMTMVSPKGRFLQVNYSLCEIVGYSEARLQATNFQSITHPDDLDTELNYIRQLLAGEIRTYQMEKRYIHRFGHIVWVWLSVSLVRDRQGLPLYFIARIQDISDRKQLEAAIAALFIKRSPTED
jgi:PAS domain S-box-containing protein